MTSSVSPMKRREGLAKLEAYMQAGGSLATEIHKTPVSERETKEAQYLDLFKGYLRALGLLELSPDAFSLTWGGQMRCEWNVQVRSYQWRLVRWLMHTAILLVPKRGYAMIAWTQFKEDGKILEADNLPKSRPQPPTQTQAVPVSSYAPSTSGLAQKRRVADISTPVFSPPAKRIALPGQTSAPETHPLDTTSSTHHDFVSCEAGPSSSPVHKNSATHQLPAKPTGLHDSPGKKPNDKTQESITAVAKPPGNSGAHAQQKEMWAAERHVLEGKLKAHALELINESRRRRFAEENATDARQKLAAERSEKQDLQAEVTELRRAVSQIPDLQEKVMGLEHVSLELRHKYDMEYQNGLTLKRELGIERQERTRLESALAGVSPEVVPSLLRMFAHVSQLTDRIL